VILLALAAVVAGQSARAPAPRSSALRRPATIIPAAPPASPSPAPDYATEAAWLCRPGRADACAANLDVAVVRADGQVSVERFRPASAPAFDCFYVYPTVSLDPTPNSDAAAGEEERAVAIAQAARFREQCRVFAPVYRQVTLAALRSAGTRRPLAGDRVMALADVTAAWKDYLARDNGGRGVVLIGHSQGAAVLKALLAETIEPSPARRSVVSAMLIGTAVGVPPGGDSGGDLRTPLCRRPGQYGCVVTYAGFREGAAPPANSRFGRAAARGLAAGCTDPVMLAGRGPTADAVFAAAGSATPPGGWARGATVAAPFVRVPGLLSVRCASERGFDWLAVRVNADPADARADTVGGEVTAGGRVAPEWGLHVIDMSVAMGDLVALAGAQARAWRGLDLPVPPRRRDRARRGSSL